jgi:hypothetical protein
VEIVGPNGEREQLLLPAEKVGVFSGSKVVNEPGPYRLWVEDPNDPAAQPKSPRVINVTVPSIEHDDPVLDEPLLRALASRTGGRYARLQDAGALLAELNDPVRERPLDEPEREELWSGQLQLLALVGLLAAEWLLRKQKNLV